MQQISSKKLELIVLTNSSPSVLRGPSEVSSGATNPKETFIDAE